MENPRYSAPSEGRSSGDLPHGVLPHSVLPHSGDENDFARTDLACEAPPSRVEESRETVDVVPGTAPVEIIRRREEGGARSVTLACGRITARGEAELEGISELLSEELRRFAEVMLGRSPDASMRILAVGLGNAHMSPDAIGPDTVRRLTVTRHLRAHDEALYGALGCCELAALCPGVLAQTGMESGELVKAAVELVHPHLVVAVDALAARSCERLASTVQLSDGGIAPGAGLGNHRMAVTAETMGCPVMGVGVPTVVDSSTLVWNALEKAGLATDALPQALREVLESGRSFVVTPKDCDEMVETTCRLLARGLNLAFGVGE